MVAAADLKVAARKHSKGADLDQIGQRGKLYLVVGAGPVGEGACGFGFFVDAIALFDLRYMLVVSVSFFDSGLDQAVLREKRYLAVGGGARRQRFVRRARYVQRCVRFSHTRGKDSSAVPGMFRDVFGLVSNDAIVRAYGGKATGFLSSEVAEPGEGAIRGGRLRDSCGMRQ